jgi:hypothetical protein
MLFSEFVKSNFYTKQYRAEFFKSIGISLMSTLGIASMRVIIFEQNYKHYLSLRGIVILSCFIAGLYLIFKALDIYEEMDNNESHDRK